MHSSQLQGSAESAGYNGRTVERETADIHRDIEALKAGLAALTRDLKADGKARADEMKQTVAQSLDSVLEKSGDNLKLVDGQVRENPRSALAIAFCAGMIANFLLRRS